MPAINDSAYSGPPTAEDLRPYQNWPDYDIEPWHLPHMAVMPSGIDLQARNSTHPMPAEAYADVGANDDFGPPATRLGLLVMMLPWLLAIASWVLFAFVKR